MLYQKPFTLLIKLKMLKIDTNYQLKSSVTSYNTSGLSDYTLQYSII